MTQFTIDNPDVLVTNDSPFLYVGKDDPFSLRWEERPSYLVTKDGKHIDMRPELVAELRKAANAQVYQLEIVAEAADALEALFDFFHVY